MEPEWIPSGSRVVHPSFCYLSLLQPQEILIIYNSTEFFTTVHNGIYWEPIVNPMGTPDYWEDPINRLRLRCSHPMVSPQDWRPAQPRDVIREKITDVGNLKSKNTYAKKLIDKSQRIDSVNNSTPRVGLWVNSANKVGDESKLIDSDSTWTQSRNR